MTGDETLPTVKLSFREDNPVIDDLVQRLMVQAGVNRRPDIVRQMIIATLKAGQEATSDADLKLMNTTLKEMRFTAKAFAPYRHRRKVTVFGSARTRPDEPLFQMASAFGLALAEAGFMVITGGGGGIMQAANEGAGVENSFGVNIQLPFEQQPNPVVAQNPRLINYKYFFNRKVAFIKEADAVALFPGGFGTLDEAMEVLTLLQTGKRYPIPLLLLDVPGGSYWQDVIRFFRQELLAKGYIGDNDLGLMTIEHDVEQATRRIAAFYRNYHSMRYFDGLLALRLRMAPDASGLHELQTRFTDLLRPGGSIRLGGPEYSRRDDPGCQHLQLLLLEHDQCNFVGLGALIEALNGLAGTGGDPAWQG